MKYVLTVDRCRAPAGSTTRRTRGRAPGRTRRSGAASTTGPGRAPTEREAEAENVTGMCCMFFIYLPECTHTL